MIWEKLNAAEKKRRNQRCSLNNQYGYSKGGEKCDEWTSFAIEDQRLGI